MIINKYIVHVLDRNSENPILNDFEGKVSLEIDKFFQKTIKGIIKDTDLRKAVFNNYEENIVRQCSEQIIYDEKSFIQNSKEIASYLFEVMKNNDEITSCDLAIVMYTNKDQRGVAIIKLDYKGLIHHDISLVDNKFNVSINKNESALSNSKPKQAALIESHGLNDEYQLRVLDKQYENVGVESKFIKKFLDIEKIVDDSYKTKEFIKVTNKVLEVCCGNEPKKLEDIKSLMNYMLKENSVFDIDRFTSNNDENTNKALKEYLEEKELYKDFNIDKKVVEKALKNRTIKTDSGFKISARLEGFEDPMKYSLRQNEDGTVDIVIKNVGYIKG